MRVAHVPLPGEKVVPVEIDAESFPPTILICKVDAID